MVQVGETPAMKTQIKPTMNRFNLQIIQCLFSQSVKPLPRNILPFAVPVLQPFLLVVILMDWAYEGKLIGSPNSSRHHLVLTWDKNAIQHMERKQ